jgi:hypothetical protein
MPGWAGHVLASEDEKSGNQLLALGPSSWMSDVLDFQRSTAQCSAAQHSIALTDSKLTRKSAAL